MSKHILLFYIHVELEANAKTTLPTNYTERAIYIIAGSIEVDYQTYKAGQMLVFDKNGAPTIQQKKNNIDTLGWRTIRRPLHLVEFCFIKKRKE